MSAPRLAPLTPADRAAVLELDQWAFAYNDADLDPDGALDSLEWDRLTGAWLPDAEGEDVLAGMCGVYSLRMGLPAARPDALPLLPIAGLTWVGVHPQFRRRGVMTSLVRDHLQQVAARGREPVSVLFAAEPAIYGRFGYGLATRALTMTVSRGAALRAVEGVADVGVRLEHLDRARHADLVSDVLEAAAAHRPGTMARDATQMRVHVLEDQPRLRHGRESLRIAVAHRGGQVTGYALFAREESWSGGSPDGTVHVRELHALDAATEAALWGRLTDLDLTAQVHTGRRPLDDRLLHLLVDPRAAKPVVHDGQYVRIVDLPTALTARRYAHDIDVVLEVSDAVLPGNAGRWRLRAGTDGAECERTEDAAQVVLDVRELGAAYLGGESITAMADAGLLTGDPAAIARASSAFRAPLAPGGCWIF